MSLEPSSTLLAKFVKAVSFMHAFIKLERVKKTDEKLFFSPSVLVDPLFQPGQVNHLYPTREQAKTLNISS